MTIVMDLGTHSVKFGPARLAQPLLIPQHVIAQSKVQYGTPSRIMDGSASCFNEFQAPVQNSKLADFDQLDRLLKIISLSTGPKLEPRLAEYIQELTRQCVQTSRAGTQVCDIEQIPLSVVQRLEQDAEPLNQLFISMLHDPEEKQHLSEILFEKFGVSKVGYGEQTALALFSSGRVSGLSVSLGHGSTQAAAIIDGYWLSSATQYYDTRVSGQFSARVLQAQLAQDQIFLDDCYESVNVLNVMKNQMQMETPRDTRFQLPDGEALTVPSHCLQKAAMVYTEPGILGFDFKPLAQSLDELSRQIPVANLKDIKTIHFSGGMANCKQLTGFLARKWFQESIQPTQSQANPQWDAYLGAQAVLMCAPDAAFISKKDFAEKGSIVWSTARQETQL